MKKIFLALCMSCGLLMADGCWSLLETSNSEMDELEGTIAFSIKDALSCENVAGATVDFGGVALKADAKGEFQVPLSVLADGQKITMVIKATDYITLAKKLEVEVGTIRGNKILLSPDLPPSSVRFVLSWADKPQDMDIHLLSDSFHISYRDTRSISGKAKLDRDAMRGFGPETITLDEIDAHKSYTVYADRYSKSGEINQNVELQVYIDNRLDKVIKLPNTKQRAVKIVTLKDGKVTYHNQAISSVPKN